MDWSGQCAVVIPCHNEAASIGEVVDAVRRYLPTVLVVNDGSTDNTAVEARRAGAIVISGSTSQGKGAALRVGWEAAAQRGFRWVLSMDGDGQHAPDDIPIFLQCARTSGASLIVGNRMDGAREMPWVRRVVNRWMSRRLSRAAGRELPDSQCGFRMMALEAWRRHPLEAMRFEIESEQLLTFLSAGEAVEFVPVQVIYRSERSKISPWRDTLRWFRWLRGWKRKHPCARPG